MVWPAVIATAGNIAGGMLSSSSSKKAAKKQFEYNRALQLYDQEFQREVAKNAHQWEMQDLQAAGLNPALTATGSSAGAIAGGSSHQSTSPGNMANFDLSRIMSDVNMTRDTNAKVEKTNAEKNAIPQQIANDTTNAKANLISAEAANKNAETQEKLAKGGRFAREIGTKLIDDLSNIQLKNNRLTKNMPKGTKQQAKKFLLNMKNKSSAK